MINPIEEIAPKDSGVKIFNEVDWEANSEMNMSARVDMNSSVIGRPVAPKSKVFKNAAAALK